jgi:hypothetical protein
VSQSNSGGPKLAHAVFFTLTDQSPEAIERQVAACRRYLTGHPGTLSFAAGPRTLDLTRSVNDQEFDVALLLVFENRAAHDRYQAAQRHQQFISESKDNWARVRVFDADVA